MSDIVKKRPTCHNKGHAHQSTQYISVATEQATLEKTHEEGGGAERGRRLTNSIYDAWMVIYSKVCQRTYGRTTICSNCFLLVYGSMVYGQLTVTVYIYVPHGFCCDIFDV
jgi:hypothetical protein